MHWLIQLHHGIAHPRTKVSRQRLWHILRTSHWGFVKTLGGCQNLWCNHWFKIWPSRCSLRNKICYIGHRRYLPKNHKWRRSLTFDGHHEYKGEPQKLSMEETLECLEKVKDITLGKPDGSKKRKRGQKDHEPKLFSRKSALWKLPYWQHLKLPHNLDVMHIEKNICDALLGIILRLEGREGQRSLYKQLS